MIFVTVGTQLAFDRLVLAVDAWAAAHAGVEVFAQIGSGATPPVHMQYTEHLPPSRADELLAVAEVIVAHAGMGSVLKALGSARPIIIMPRRAALGEHRNDHQMATARWLEGRPGVRVAWNETEVSEQIDDRASITAGAPISPYANEELVRRLRDALLGFLNRTG